MIGRLPTIAAFGNCKGARQVLEYAKAGAVHALTCRQSFCTMIITGSIPAVQPNDYRTPRRATFTLDL